MYWDAMKKPITLTNLKINKNMNNFKQYVQENIAELIVKIFAEPRFIELRDVQHRESHHVRYLKQWGLRKHVSSSVLEQQLSMWSVLSTTCGIKGKTTTKWYQGDVLYFIKGMKTSHIMFSVRMLVVWLMGKQARV